MVASGPKAFKLRLKWVSVRSVLSGSLLLTGSLHASTPPITCDELEAVLAPSATVRVGSADEYLAVDDAEKQSTVCTWRFALGSRDATSAHTHLVDVARDCLGASAAERVGEPVNHPDAFVAHYFDRPDVTLSVALKHKAALRETRVSLRVDRLRAAAD